MGSNDAKLTVVESIANALGKELPLKSLKYSKTFHV